MQALRKFLITIALIALLGVCVFIVVTNYSYIFSKTVDGQIFQVERVTNPTMIVGSAAANSPTAMFSFAVAIRDSEGKIFTSSSEDRQWAVAQRGFCVKAKFYPYPPWDLDKADTYSNARLISLHECPPGLPALPEFPASAKPGQPFPPGVHDMNAPAPSPETH